jgi:hypothetical protein
VVHVRRLADDAARHALAVVRLRRVRITIAAERIPSKEPRTEVPPLRRLVNAPAPVLRVEARSLNLHRQRVIRAPPPRDEDATAAGMRAGAKGSSRHALLLLPNDARAYGHLPPVARIFRRLEADAIANGRGRAENFRDVKKDSFPAPTETGIDLDESEASLIYPRRDPALEAIGLGHGLDIVTPDIGRVIHHLSHSFSDRTWDTGQTPPKGGVLSVRLSP